MMEQHASLVLYNKTQTEESQQNAAPQEARHGGQSPAQHLWELQHETKMRKLHVLIAYSHVFTTVQPEAKAARPQLRLNLDKSLLIGKGSSKGDGFIKSETFYPVSW